MMAARSDPGNTHFLTSGLAPVLAGGRPSTLLPVPPSSGVPRPSSHQTTSQLQPLNHPINPSELLPSPPSIPHPRFAITPLLVPQFQPLPASPSFPSPSQLPLPSQSGLAPLSQTLFHAQSASTSFPQLPLQPPQGHMIPSQMPSQPPSGLMLPPQFAFQSPSGRANPPLLLSQPPLSLTPFTQTLPPPQQLSQSLSALTPLIPSPPSPVLRSTSFRRSHSLRDTITADTAPAASPTLQPSWSMHVPKLQLGAVSEQPLSDNPQSMTGGIAGASIDREYQARYLTQNPRRSNPGTSSMFPTFLDPGRRPSGSSFSPNDRPPSRPSSRHSTDGNMFAADWAFAGVAAAPDSPLPARQSLPGLSSLSPDSHFTRRQLSPLIAIPSSSERTLTSNGGTSPRISIDWKGDSSSVQTLLNSSPSLLPDGGLRSPRTAGILGQARRSNGGNSLLLDVAVAIPTMNPRGGLWSEAALGQVSNTGVIPTPPPELSLTNTPPTFARQQPLSGLQPSIRSKIQLEASSPTLPPSGMRRSPSNRFIPLCQMQNPSAAGIPTVAASLELLSSASDVTLGESDCGPCSPSPSNSTRSSNSSIVSPASLTNLASGGTSLPPQQLSRSAAGGEGRGFADEDSTDGFPGDVVHRVMSQPGYSSLAGDAPPMHTTLTLAAVPHLAPSGNPVQSSRSLGVARLPALNCAVRTK